VRRDFVRTRVSEVSKTSLSEVEAALGDLERNAAADLLADGFPAQRQRFAPSLDMRYVGQSFELSVPIGGDVASIAELERAFAEIYAARYGAATGRPMEIVNYRLAAWGLADKPQLPRLDPAGRSLAGAGRGARSVSFGGSQHHVTVLDRDRLPISESIEGPVLIEEAGSTTIVPAGWRAKLDSLGCLVMRRS
jgi:N-methylhydantoinase A